MWRYVGLWGEKQCDQLYPASCRWQRETCLKWAWRLCPFSRLWWVAVLVRQEIFVPEYIPANAEPVHTSLGVQYTRHAPQLPVELQACSVFFPTSLLHAPEKEAREKTRAPEKDVIHD